MEKGAEFSSGYTSNFVTFSTPGKRRHVQYVLLTQNSGDRETHTAENVEDMRMARLYKISNNNTPVLRQMIQVGQVMSAETFTTPDKNRYLAVLSPTGRNDQNELTRSASITIFAWTGKRFRRSPQQEIPAPRQGVKSIAIFTMNGQVYLTLVGAAAEGGRYGTWVTLYRWSTHEQTPGQFYLAYDHDFSEALDHAGVDNDNDLIQSDASHVKHFSISGYHFLSVSTTYDGVSTSTNSYLFQVYATCGELFGCVQLHLRQKLPTIGAAYSEYFSFRSERFLVFANSYKRNMSSGFHGRETLDNFQVGSSIYRLNLRTQLFEPFQEITTVAANTVKFVSVCKEAYLIVTSRLPNETLQEILNEEPYAKRTAIFRWRGIEKFQPWLSLPLGHRTWHMQVLRTPERQHLAESFISEYGIASSRLLDLRTTGGDCGSGSN